MMNRSCRNYGFGTVFIDPGTELSRFITRTDGQIRHLIEGLSGARLAEGVGCDALTLRRSDLGVAGNETNTLDPARRQLVPAASDVGEMIDAHVR